MKVPRSVLGDEPENRQFLALLMSQDIYASCNAHRPRLGSGPQAPPPPSPAPETGATSDAERVAQLDLAGTRDYNTGTMSSRPFQRPAFRQALAGLQPLLLLPVLTNLSSIVGSHVSHTQALARTLLLGGQQRLHDLLAAAPRLRLPEKWESVAACFDDENRAPPEEAAVQALLELFLGLILQVMAAYAQANRTTGASSGGQRALPLRSPPVPSPRPAGARLCFLPPSPH